MKNRNPKYEIPAFVPQGGASRRQAKFETNRGNKIKYI
jgi:hypothetical protein